MNDRFIFILALIALSFLGACDQDRPGDGDILLAEVGNERLYLSEVRQVVPAQQFSQDSLQAIHRYRNNWVKRQLKVHEARRLDLHNHQIIRQRIRQAEHSILADALNELMAMDISAESVSRAEAQVYYESNRDKFILAERHIRYRHMIAGSMADAQAARNALMRGRGWLSVAHEYSINPQQAIRSSQRFFPASSAAREFQPLHDFLQVIGISEISPVRQIGNQYHFVQLMESRESGEHPQVDWVIDQISEWLLLERKRKHLQAMEQNLLLQAQANNEIRLFDLKEPQQEIQIAIDSL